MLERSALALAGFGLAIAAVAFLLALVVGAAWLYYDDPGPRNPTDALELNYDGARVNECLVASETERGAVWICSFFRMPPGLRAELVRESPSATPTRVGCFLEQRSDSDPAPPLGYASPNRLLLSDRCRSAIDEVRALPSPAGG